MAPLMARAAGIAGRLGSNAVRIVRRGVGHFALPRGPIWIRIRLAPPIEDLLPPALFRARDHSLSFLELLQVFEHAALDPRVEGVLIRLEGVRRGLARVLTLRRAIERLRAAGKPVVIYGETLSSEDMLLASAASRLWLPESGSVFLLGLRFESYFVKDLLGSLGVEPEVVRVGGFKSAAEILTRERMSPEHREQLEELIDDSFATLVDGIAKGRGIDADRVRTLIDGGPYLARAAVEAGLVDACLYPDQIEDALEELTSSKQEVEVVDAPAYSSFFASDPGFRPLLGDFPRIAYVVAEGAIHRGGGLRGVACEVYRSLLERIREDAKVRGMVLRIDSPGGDGVASDLIWRAVRQVRTEKPVVVSMGDVAASGGYYVAAAADAILAEPATVTGSIGVVGGKVNLAGLYQRLGVGKDAVERGARAGLLSEMRSFTPDERSAVRDEMKAIYELFLERVAEGRSMTRDQVNRVAQGRIWSGGRAKSLGLVDGLGGPLEALEEVRRRAGIAPGESILVDVHPRLPRIPGLFALIRSLVPRAR
jgi:protease-4